MKQTKIEEARQKTDDAKYEAEDECRAQWRNEIEGIWDEDVNDFQLFERVNVFFNQATKLVAEDKTPNVHPFLRHWITAILVTKFTYDFPCYDWDGTDFSEDTATDELDQAAWARWVVDALEEYILTAAARAKTIGSDTYASWRTALADLNFRFDRFSDCAEKKHVEEFLANIRRAAQNLWADAAILRKVSPRPVLSPKGGKGKKATKKAR